MSFEGDLSAGALQAGSVYMRSDGANKANFKGVSLLGAKIAGMPKWTGRASMAI